MRCHQTLLRSHGKARSGFSDFTRNALEGERATRDYIRMNCTRIGASQSTYGERVPEVPVHPRSLPALDRQMSLNGSVASVAGRVGDRKPAQRRDCPTPPTGSG